MKNVDWMFRPQTLILTNIEIRQIRTKYFETLRMYPKIFEAEYYKCNNSSELMLPEECINLTKNNNLIVCSM